MGWSLLVLSCTGMPSAADVAVVDPDEGAALDRANVVVPDAVPLAELPSLAPREDDEAPDDDEDDAQDEVAPRIAVSPTEPGRLAIWTDTAIMGTTDDAASFDEILAASDHTWEVAVDPRGTIWALRGPRLGRRDRDGHERWNPTPPSSAAWLAGDEGTVRLAASSRFVALAVPSETADRLADVFATRDRGGTWRPLAVDAPMSSPSISTIDIGRLAIDDRGRVDAAITWGQGNSCAVTYESTHRGRIGSGGADVIAEYDDRASEIIVAHDGWAYARCWDSGEPEPCVHAPLPDATGHEAHSWVPTTIEVNAIVVHRRATFGQVGRTVVSLRAGRATTRVDDLPEDARLVEVDAAERPIVARDGQLERREPGGAWTRLGLSR